METQDVEIMDKCPDKVSPPGSLEELISRLSEIFQSDKVNIDYVKALMSSYKSKRSEWKKFAKFDVNRYTRNLVDVGNGKYNLILVCWKESQASSIHSHSGSHCFMTVLDGQVKETLFGWPNDSDPTTEMKVLDEISYDVGQTAYINDDLGLHRVEIGSHTDEAVSLHLYSPPFDECQCFDQGTGHCTKAKVTFWSKFGKRTPFRSKDQCLTQKEHNYEVGCPVSRDGCHDKDYLIITCTRNIDNDNAVHHMLMYGCGADEGNSQDTPYECNVGPGVNCKREIIGRFWIGLSDQYDNDTWYWTDSTALGHYDNWLTREPHNVLKGIPENCAAILVRMVIGAKWFDAPCQRKQEFVCERI